MSRKRFGPYSFEASNLSKPLFPDGGPTKGEIMDYYAGVARWMLPHLEERPLTLHRFPDNIEEDGFWQQEAGEYFPHWVERAHLPKEQGHVEHVLARRAADLAYLAQLGTIGVHAWLSRAQRPRTPDRLVFDLDPPDADRMEPVRDAARQLRERLSGLGLTAFLKTSGSKGLHLVCPLRPGPSFERMREFAGALAEELAATDPERFTTEQRKDKRAGRVFLDTVRNSYGHTMVAPYSLRPLPGAPVSAPLRWDELDRFAPRDLTLDTVPERLERRGCPWKGMGRHAAGLPGG